MNLSTITEKLRSTPLILSLAFAVTAVSVSFSFHGLTAGFVISSLNSLIVSHLPGWALTAGILGMGDTAQTVGLGLSTGLILTLYAGCAALGFWLKRVVRNTSMSIVIPTVSVWMIETWLTGNVRIAIYSGVAGGCVLLITHIVGVQRPARYLPEGIELSDRRRVLAGVATAAVGLVWGVSTGRDRRLTLSLEDVDESTATDARNTAAEINNNYSLDVDGLDPLISASFFEVDINSANPAVDADQYSLTVTDKQATSSETYSYQELLAHPSETVPLTLRCVGESRNGQKMDTAVWSAIALPNLIDFESHSDTCCVRVTAADGYYQEFPLSALETGYLAYGMNGEILPRAHGHPFRLLVPGHWGEINVKWITGIEIRDEETTGYWEERGWHGTGPVNTVAKIHVVNQDDNSVEVAGHAYAGTRGVGSVEVSTNGGDTWNIATLSERLPGDDVWRQWVYRFEKTGTHEVVARVVEDDGTIQSAEETGPFPRGASGYVTIEIS